MADLVPRGTKVEQSPAVPAAAEPLVPKGTKIGGPKGYLENPDLDIKAYEEAQRRLNMRPKGKIGAALDLIDRGADNYAFNVSRPISGLREMLPGGGGFNYGKAIDRYYDEGIQEDAGWAGTGAEVAGSILSPSPFGKAKLGYQAGEAAVMSGVEALNQTTETDNTVRDATVAALTGGTVASAVGSIGRHARPLEETEVVGAGQELGDVIGQTRKKVGVEGLTSENAGLELREALITDLLGKGGGKKGITRNTKAVTQGMPNLKKIIEDDSIPGSVIADEIMNLGSRSGKKNAAKATANVVSALGDDAAALQSLRAGMLQNLLKDGNPAQSQQRIQRFLDENQELVGNLFTAEQADALSELNVMMSNTIQPNTPQADKFGQLLSTVLGPQVGGIIGPFLKGKGGGAAALVTGGAGLAAGLDPVSAAAASLGPLVLNQAVKVLGTRPARQAISAAASRPTGVARIAAEQAVPALVGGNPEPPVGAEDLKRRYMEQLLQQGGR